MQSEFAAFKRATAAKRRADERFHAALLAAVDAGHTYAELAEVVGVSRQAVWQLVTRLRDR